MADKTKNISIVDKGFTVDGTVSTTGRLIVKGTIKGTLDGDVVMWWLFRKMVLFTQRLM